MKKLALVFALMMLIPCSAFGMQMLNNSNMDQITGQSGVSIDFDDVQLFMHIDTVAYIDSDGFSTALVAPTLLTSTEPGAIAIDNFTLNLLNVNAIIGTSPTNNLAGSAGAYSASVTGTNLSVQNGPNMHLSSAGSIPLFYNYATSDGGAVYLNGAGAMSYGLQTTTYLNPSTGLHTGVFQPRFLTIDVTNQLPVASAAAKFLTGSAAATEGGVLIGIPTMEVYINNLTLTPYYTGAIGTVTAAANSATCLNEGKDYGTFQMKGITFTTLSGWIEIAPH